MSNDDFINEIESNLSAISNLLNKKLHLIRIRLHILRLIYMICFDVIDVKFNFLAKLFVMKFDLEPESNL